MLEGRTAECLAARRRLGVRLLDRRQRHLCHCQVLSVLSHHADVPPEFYWQHEPWLV
jgi:hypothetical protein